MLTEVTGAQQSAQGEGIVTPVARVRVGEVQHFDPPYLDNEASEGLRILRMLRDTDRIQCDPDLLASLGNNMERTILLENLQAELLTCQNKFASKDEDPKAWESAREDIASLYARIKELIQKIDTIYEQLRRAQKFATLSFHNEPVTDAERKNLEAMERYLVAQGGMKQKLKSLLDALKPARLSYGGDLYVDKGPSTPA